MNRRNLITLASLASLSAVAGCQAEVLDPPPEKSEVSALGAADWGYDVCDAYGWYDDAVCDDFCPLPDPDCDLSPAVTTAAVCEHDGDDYEPGDSIPDADGCNSCTCQDDGTWICTMRGCAAVTTCELDGQHHEVGDTVPADDGCNSCTCQDDGMFLCTQRDCAPTGVCFHDGMWLDAGESFASDGCNRCTCQPSGLILCTQRDCAPAD